MSLSTSAVSQEELCALYVLDSLKGFGPQKFKQVYEAKLTWKDLLRQPDLLPVRGKLGDPLRAQLRALSSSVIDECTKRAEKQLAIAEKTQSLILTYAHPLYPKRVFASNNPVPVLYVRGHIELLSTLSAVACVGSRNLRPP